MIDYPGRRVPPLTEEQRQAALESYAVLDSAAEPEFDALAQLAAQICEAPIALVSFLDHERQWFKSCIGLESRETPRAIAFCSYTIESSEPLIVADARLDRRFADNPLVVGAPGIRFYAGIPLVDDDGAALGTLCVIDVQPRELAATQLASLRVLARQVVAQLHLRRLLLRETALRRENERAQRHAQFVAEAGKMLGVSLDVNATLGAIASMVVPALADLCTIMTVEDDGSLRRLAESASDASASEQVRTLRSNTAASDAPLIMREAVAARKAILVADYQAWIAERLPRDHAYVQLIAGLRVRGAICVPMLVGDRVRGVLNVAVLERTGRVLDQRDVTAMEELAQRAALALENARLFAEVSAANLMKDAFLAAVSHDLRTPLSAILGWTQMLKNRGDDPAYRERAVEIIERNARAQSRLIEDLLDISRIDAQRLDIEHRPVDLVAIVTAALDDLRPTADAKGVRLEPTLDPRGCEVMGDGGRLQQVVWNLVSNAIKFSPRGGVVDVDLACATDRAVLTVRDHGRGIPAELLPHIFDRFRQDDAGEGKRLGGLGLGLSIAKHIVDAAAGTITAESEGPGKGAVVRVTLPLNVEVNVEVARPAVRG